jgi:hypothetical protein
MATSAVAILVTLTSTPAAQPHSPDNCRCKVVFAYQNMYSSMYNLWVFSIVGFIFAYPYHEKIHVAFEKKKIP